MKNKIWKTGLSACILIGNMNLLYVNAEENPDQSDVTEIILEKTEEEEEGISPSEEITVQEIIDGETDHTENNSAQNIDINEYEPISEITEETNVEGTEDRIHFIHLGSTSNDSFVIESNGHYGLIDTANPINSEHGYNGTIEDGNSVVTVIQYLKKLGVDHLDFVLSTHSHSDHIGGVPAIAEIRNSNGTFFVDENTTYIYKQYEYIQEEESEEENRLWYNSAFYEDAVNAMKSHSANMLMTNSPDAESLNKIGAVHHDASLPETEYLEFPFGDYTIRLYNLYTVTRIEENTNSIVALVMKDDIKTLFMGDMNVRLQTEQKIVRAITDEIGAVDVFKLGHHGNHFSTSYETLCLTNAKYAVITGYGKGNGASFYHYFKDHNTPVYQTGDHNTALVLDLSEGSINWKAYDENGLLQAKPVEWTPAYIYIGWNRMAYDENKWDYIYINDDYTLKKGWDHVSGNNWYYFNEDGIMQRGTQLIDGIEYEFDEDGKLIDPTTLPDQYKYTGFFLLDEKWYYGNGDGTVLTGWLNYKNAWYYMEEETGKMHTGWAKIMNSKGEEYWYYFDDQGKMQTGWLKLIDQTGDVTNTSWYYMDQEGKMYTGWFEVKGADPKQASKWYFFQGNGKMAVDWCKVSDTWYYFDETGVMQTGWISRKDEVTNQVNWFYLQKNGIMLKGWLQENKNWYYMNSSGIMQTGWQDIDGNWYYFKSSGVMVTGKYTIDKNEYQFNSNGALINVDSVPKIYRTPGWIHSGNYWRYVKPDYTYAKGWLKVKDSWYYFSSNGVMQIGWKKISGNWYYLKDSGAMATDWQKINNIWYYLDSSGIMQTGWKQINNVWYYFDTAGKMAIGWKQIGKQWYYFKISGAMATDWQKINNIWYYLDSSGIMQTGWKQIKNVWYYFDTAGKMAIGWKQIGKQWYYFKNSGAMATDWQKINNIWYYLDSSGIMQTGWKQIKNVWYYFEGSGKMKTGWLSIKQPATDQEKTPVQNSYYFNTSGAMMTGWLKLTENGAEHWYYFDKSGIMVTGEQVIGGKKYNFGTDGVMIEETDQNNES